MTRSQNGCLLALIAILVFIAYYPALTAPFYLDDFESITQNLIVQNGEVSSILKVYGFRFITYLSFKLNYLVGGLEVFGFHITNIIIHVLTSFSLYFLIYQIARSINFEPSDKGVVYFSVIVSALYALHPVNSQAVIYIVQRAALFAALFYILSVLFYLRFRLANSHNPFYFFLFLLCFCCALFSKQNTMTIPFVLIACELFLIRKIKARTWWLILLSVSLLAFTCLLFEPNLLTSLDRVTRETQDVSRLTYLQQQFVIVWIYVSKALVPWHLRLEYPYTIASFSMFLTSISALAHCCVILFALYIRKKHSFVTFFVAFFYISMSVESSIIPIRDLAFEHRMYLPSVAIYALSIYAAHFLVLKFTLRNKATFKTIMFLSLIVLTLLTVGTFQRAFLWQDKEAFYKNEIAMFPNSSRLYTNLATYYISKNSKVSAAEMYLKAFELSIENEAISPELLSNVIAIYIDTNNIREAGRIYQLYLPKIKDRHTRSNILLNFGVAFMRLGNPSEAEKFLIASINNNPQNVKSYVELGRSYAREGRYKDARQLVNKALALSPSEAAAIRLSNQLKPY